MLLKKRPKILYLSKKGRRQRIKSGGPSEFMFGLIELQAKGWSVDLLEDEDIGLIAPKNRSFFGLVNHAFNALIGVPIATLASLWRWTDLDTLKFYDLVVVTTNSFGICVGLMKVFGRLNTPVIFIAMGLIEKNTSSIKTLIFRRILYPLRVLSLSKNEAAFLRRRLGIPVEYIPFGIDINFWKPMPSKQRNFFVDEYVISIGNDRHRDYDTLIKAWKISYPKLLIITKLKTPKLKPNILVYEGDWQTEVFDDQKIREIINDAKFVIVPVKQTFQPSGQSVILQAMACGKASIVNDFDGLWDRNVMIDKVNCVFSGVPGSISNLQGAVEWLNHNDEERLRIGARARSTVIDNLNSSEMATCLSKQINELI